MGERLPPKIASCVRTSSRAYVDRSVPGRIALKLPTITVSRR
jgi:hypothetical protein